MSIERVIVHGYLATPSDHWFGWLREELAADQITVEIPALPDSRAETIIVPGAGHFLDTDGITQLPQLAKYLASFDRARS